MAIVIEGVPPFISREDYIGLIESVGFDARAVQELRFSRDGVHAVVFYRDEDGHPKVRQPPARPGYHKHRVFIPVRDSDDDKRTTRVRPVKRGK